VPLARSLLRADTNVWRRRLTGATLPLATA
jgi:hypothetical protein